MKSNLFLTLLLLGSCNLWAQPTETGDINGATYRIYLPDNWDNQGLVMYAHGYESIGEEVEDDEEEDGIDPFIQLFLNRGFAFAASSYKRQGLVIKDGIEDTEALRSYFEIKYGKPELTIITGHSMGGMISLASIELYPAEYDGALPLCGWLAPVYNLMKGGLDMLATYDYLFGDNSGQVIATTEPFDPETFEKGLAAKEELAALFSERYTIRRGDMAEMLAFFQYVLLESTTWMGGLMVENQQTIYSGFGDIDIELNKNIRRYTANPSAKEYLIEYNTPTGQISDPVLALHTTYDEILPVFNYRYYEEMVNYQGNSDLYVQQYVVRDGHCFFETEEIEAAFQELLHWIKDGKRPENVYR